MRIRYRSGVTLEVGMQKPGKIFILREPAKSRKGFSLVEAIMVVAFIGILAAIAVPKLNMAVISKYKAKTTAKKIVTDLRRVRGLAITNAANNISGFSLRLLNVPCDSYEIVNLGTEEILDSCIIDPDVSVAGAASEFEFGPLGNLTSSFTQITVSAEGKTFTITIIKATGMIKCVES
jgi:prepilin-type N-terminal cleavage/methylation domain-containing protein